MHHLPYFFFMAGQEFYIFFSIAGQDFFFGKCAI
jgi:hypothetical protein